MIQCRNGERHSHTMAAEARECWRPRIEREQTPSEGANMLADSIVRALRGNAPAPLADQVAPVGTYRLGDDIYRVVQRPNGHRRAERLHGGAYVYAAGMVFRLQAQHRMTLEEEQEYGRTEHRCIRCGTELTNKESQEAGIGPVCVTKW